METSGTGQMELGPLILSLVADVSNMQTQFAITTKMVQDLANSINTSTKGIERSLNEMSSTTINLLNQTKPAIEKYKESMVEVDAARKAGAITAEHAAAAEAKLKSVLPEVVAQKEKDVAATKARNAALAEGQAITQKYQSDTEKVAITMARLAELHAAGFINVSTYTRAVADANKQTKAYADSQRQASQTQKEVASIIERVTSGNDKHAKTVARLTQLWREGHLTLAQYNAAVNQSYRTTETYTQAQEKAAQATQRTNQIIQRGLSVLASTQTQYQRIRQQITQLTQAYRLGEISIRRYQQAMRQLRAEILNLGKGFRLTLNQLQDIRMGMMSLMQVTAPLLAMLSAIGAVSIREFGKMDLSMQKAFSIMRNLDAQTEKMMKSLAADFSKDTIHSLESIGQAYYWLAATGLDTEKVIKAMPIVMDFATAGAYDLAKATDILSDSLQAFGWGHQNMNTDDYIAKMTRMADTVANTANRTNATIEQFADALVNDAAVAAKNFGMEIETLMATLGTFANVGYKGEEAGNMLGRALRLLGVSYQRKTEEFRKYNIEIQTGQGNYKNFIEIIEQLEKSFSKMGAAQRTLAMSEMGMRAMQQRPLLALIGQSANMRALEKELKNSAGTIERMVKTQMKALINQMIELGNRVKVVAMEIGTYLVPVLKFFMEIINRLTIAWEGLSDTMKGTVVVIGVVAGAIFLVATAAFAAAAGLATLGIIKIYATKGWIALGGAAAWAWSMMTAGGAIPLIIAATAAVGLIVAGVTGYYAGLAKEADRAKKKMEDAAKAAAANKVVVQPGWIDTEWANKIGDLSLKITTFNENLQDQITPLENLTQKRIDDIEAQKEEIDLLEKQMVAWVNLQEAQRNYAPHVIKEMRQEIEGNVQALRKMNENSKEYNDTLMEQQRMAAYGKDAEIQIAMLTKQVELKRDLTDWEKLEVRIRMENVGLNEKDLQIMIDKTKAQYDIIEAKSKEAQINSENNKKLEDAQKWYEDTNRQMTREIELRRQGVKDIEFQMELEDKMRDGLTQAQADRIRANKEILDYQKEYLTLAERAAQIRKEVNPAKAMQDEIREAERLRELRLLEFEEYAEWIRMIQERARKGVNLQFKAGGLDAVMAGTTDLFQALLDGQRSGALSPKAAKAAIQDRPDLRDFERVPDMKNDGQVAKTEVIPNPEFLQALREPKNLNNEEQHHFAEEKRFWGEAITHLSDIAKKGGVTIKHAGFNV